jgi:hypothetical protein
MEFNKIYFQNNQEGLLELCFVNAPQKNYLRFNGGSFEMIAGVFDRKNFSEFPQTKKINEVTSIRENDDMDFILSTNDYALIKILFTPNDSYPNGVEQVIRLYYPDDVFYPELLEDLNDSKDIFTIKT